MLVGCGNGRCSNPLCKSNPNNRGYKYNDADASKLAVKMTMNKHKKCESFNNEKMKKMEKRLDLLEARRERVDRMDLDQLTELKQTMQDKIKLIEEAEKRLMENITKCIVCLDNDKCISFDGCEHIALCQECESGIIDKKCPICRTQYSNIKKIKFN